LIRKHQNKIRGVKGAKPRFKTNGKPASKEEIDKLSKEYLQIRNEQQRTKTLSAQMELAIQLGDLISRKLVGQQVSYLLVAFREKAPADR
jgi:hypothetical protein